MFTYYAQRNEAKIEKLRKIRNRGINKLIEAEKCSILQAALKYDSEIAPESTEREVFAEYLGCILPTQKEFADRADELGLTDGERQDAKMAFAHMAMQAYTMWGTQIINWQHLSTDALYAVLQKCLTDKVRPMAPTPMVSEFLDMSTCPV